MISERAYQDGRADHPSRPCRAQSTSLSSFYGANNIGLTFADASDAEGRSPCVPLQGHLIHLPSPKPRVSRIRPVENPPNQQEDRDVEAEWDLEEKKLSCEQSKPTQRIPQCLTTNPPPPASMPRLGWGLKINGWNGWMDGPGKSRAWSLAVLASRPASSETASGARPGAARFGMCSAENMNKCLPANIRENVAEKRSI